MISGLRQIGFAVIGALLRRLLLVVMLACAMAQASSTAVRAALDVCPLPSQVELPVEALKAALRARLEDRGIRHFLNVSAAPGGSLYAYLFVVAPTMPAQAVEAYLGEIVADLRRKVLHRFDRRIDFATGSFFQFLHKPELETQDTKEWIYSHLGNEIIESFVASWRKIRHLCIEKTSPSTAKITCVVLGESKDEKSMGSEGDELITRIRHIVDKSFPTLRLHEESVVHVLPASPASPISPAPQSFTVAKAAPDAAEMSRLRSELEGKLRSEVDRSTVRSPSKTAPWVQGVRIGPAIMALRKEVDGRLRRVETQVGKVDSLFATASINRVRLDEMQKRLLELAELAVKLSQRIEKRPPPAEILPKPPVKVADTVSPSLLTHRRVVERPLFVKAKSRDGLRAGSGAAGAITRLEHAVARLGPEAVSRFRKGRHARGARGRRRRRRGPRFPRFGRRRRKSRSTASVVPCPAPPSVPSLRSSMESPRVGAGVEAPSREKAEEEARLRRLREAIQSL